MDTLKKCSREKKCSIELNRVSYAQKDTPRDMREYTIEDSPMPVGTKEEWKKYFKDRKINAKLKFND